MTKLRFIAVALAASLFGQDNVRKTPPQKDQEVLFRLKEGVALSDVDLKGADPLSVRGVGGIAGTYHLRSRSRSTERLIAMLQANPLVSYVEPNILWHTQTLPRLNANDPLFTSPYSWSLELIHAAEAWYYSTGSSSVAIGVIDTGVRTTHEDLSPNIWTSPGSFSLTIGGVGISCGASTRGFDAYQFTFNNSNYCAQSDASGHGTSVAGIAAARGQSSGTAVGLAGVSWTSIIVPVGVSSLAGGYLNCTGCLDTASLANAIEFLVQANLSSSTGLQNKIRVMNNSWGCFTASDGCFDSLTLQTEVLWSGQNGLLFVAAAGNGASGGDITTLASASHPTFAPTSWAQSTTDPTLKNYFMPSILGVSATDLSGSTEELAPYSNYGLTSVALAAPGGNHNNTGITTTGFSSDSTYVSNFDGTSAAAPVVSGAAAVLAAKCGAYTGMLGLKNTLVNNVDTLSFLSGKVTSGGRLNLYKALKSCMLQNFSVSPAAGSGTAHTFTFSFSDSAGWQDLQVMNALIRVDLNGAGACYFGLTMLSSSSGIVQLVSDSGAGIAGNLTLPSSSSVNNSQCTFAGTGSSVSGSGNTITLTLAVTFNTTNFSGDKTIFLAARDQDNQSSGWESMGTWSVNTSTSPIGFTSFSPQPLTSSGAQTVSVTVNDTSGYADLVGVQVLVSPMTPAGRNGCYATYVRSSNLLYLVQNDGVLIGTGYAPGTAATLFNSQCQINVGSVSVTNSGNSETLVLPITFFAGFKRNHVVFVGAQGTVAGNTGWHALSTSIQ